MAIIVGGKVFDPNKKVEVETPQPKTEKKAIEKKRTEPRGSIESNTLNARYRIERKQVSGVASDEASLVVNGKQKSIGKKSKYLLDMLTLDDE